MKKHSLEKWHQQGRELTNNHCEICHKWFEDEMLCGHHPNTQKAHPEWRLNPINRLIVCQYCHNKIHNGEIKIDKTKYRPETN